MFHLSTSSHFGGTCTT